MKRWLLPWMMAQMLLGSGCAHTLDRRAPKFALKTAVDRAFRGSEVQAKRRSGAPLVVLIERRGVRAVDPIAAVENWWLPLQVTGHAVATADLVVLPIRGRRVVAVDRDRGTIVWETQLPGEALVGLAATRDTIVAAVATPARRTPARILGLDVHDGQIRWSRRLSVPVGGPAAAGDVAFVPLVGRVLALETHRGRLLASRPLAMDEHAHPRAQVHRRTIVVGHGHAWFDLRAGEPIARQLERDDAPLFHSVGNLDAGYDDAERMHWWVRMSEVAGSPREGILLARRAVLAMRADAAGRMIAPHWAYLAEDEREFVGLHVGSDRLTLVRDDGSILMLSTEHGHVLAKIGGGDATVGALLIDMDVGRIASGREREAPTAAAMAATLERMMLVTDPRLLTAQLVLAELAWRSEQPTLRKLVERVARGELRAEAGSVAYRLRAHAQRLLARPWGPAEAEHLDQLIARLSQVPRFTRDIEVDVSTLARAALASGREDVVAPLVSHLLHPATRAVDLEVVANTLRELDRATAVEGVATFVRRYHADTEVVDESQALQRAIDFLLQRAADERSEVKAAREIARRTLAQVEGDPFTAPSLRAYIERARTALPTEPP